MPVKGYRKHNSKNARIDLRVTAEEKARWERTAEFYGFKSVSDMIRFLVENVNTSRVCDEIVHEVKDVEVGEGIII